MALKTPEASVAAGLAAAGLVYAVFDMSLPPLADVRTLDTGNKDVSGSERTATAVSGALVAGLGLLTGDATVFVIGGSMVIALAWLYRHANEVSPLTGTMLPGNLTVPGADSAAPPATETIYTDEFIG
jgi:hypothetical protein